MIFIDTNILVPFLSPQHSQHDRAKHFLLEQARHGIAFAISPQVIGETFRVLTSPKAVSDPFHPRVLLHVLMDLLDDSNLHVVSPGKQAIEVALTAAAQRGISSAKIFDLLLYGTMIQHGITRLATFNERDFRELVGIELVPVP